VEVPATAVVAVDGLVHYDHMEVVAEDFETAGEVVADHTVAAGNLVEHNWGDNFAQRVVLGLEHVVHEVDGLPADAEEVRDAEHVVGRVADHVAGRAGHCGCAVAIEVRHTHSAHLVAEDQEFEDLYMADDEAVHCSQLAGLVLG
jgi:hypothetical protein